MAAFRPVSPLTVFQDNLGAPCAGGFLRFYDTLTLDSKSVYSDEDLSVNLGAEVELDSAGRAPSDIWGAGVYRIRLYTSEDVLVDEAGPVQEEGAAGSAIPSQTGHSGKALFTDGSTMSWLDVEQLPDMTGQADKYLTNDGTDASWVAISIPDLPADGIEDTATTIRVGDSLIQVGTGTAPASSAHTTSLAIVFATAYASTPKVFITPLENSITPNGYAPVYAVKSLTTTGCSVHFDVNSDLSGASYNIDTTIPFDYMVIGRI